MKIPEKKKYTGKYEPKLKIAIVHEYLTTNLGYANLSKKYNIPKTTIKDFVTWYKQKYSEDDENVNEIAIETLNNEPLNDSDLKVIALQMLIENASKELGVDIVKKFGTKQPKK